MNRATPGAGILGLLRRLCAQNPQPFTIQFRWGPEAPGVRQESLHGHRVEPLAGCLGDISPTVGNSCYMGSFGCQRTHTASPCAETYRRTHTPMYAHVNSYRDTHKSKHTHAHMYTHTRTHTRNHPRPFQTLGPWESGPQAVVG